MFGKNQQESERNHPSHPANQDLANKPADGLSVGPGMQEGHVSQQEAAANKPAEEQALDKAAGDSGSEQSEPTGYQQKDGSEVVFEGRKVVDVLPAEEQRSKGFVHCRMSDGTTTYVPESLFAVSPLAEEDSN